MQEEITHLNSILRLHFFSLNSLNLEFFTLTRAPVPESTKGFCLAETVSSLGKGKERLGKGTVPWGEWSGRLAATMTIAQSKASPLEFSG